MRIKVIVTIILILIIIMLPTVLNLNIVKAGGKFEMDQFGDGTDGGTGGGTVDTTIEDIKDGVGNFMSAGKNQNNPLNQEELKSVSNTVYNILLAVGIIAAVIVGLIIGIKYMVGSVAQKAETKELLVPYIIGCVIIFGAFAIWKIIVELLNQTQI